MPHASGQSYIVGIRGEVFNYEASAGKVVQVDPQNPNGTVYHTNHPVKNDNLKSWYAEYHPDKSSELQTDNSYIRLASLESRMSHDQIVNADLIKETLRSRDDPSNPVCRTNNGRGFTFGSTIMTLTGELHMMVTAGPPDESEYQRYDFSSRWTSAGGKK